MTEEFERPADLGSVTDVRRANKEAKRTAITQENALRTMLSTPAAREFFWSHLESCGIFAQEFHPNANAHYFRSGERNAGLRLYAVIPDDIKALMAQEHKEKTNA